MIKKILFVLLLILISEINIYSQVYQWNQLQNSPVPDSASQRFEDIDMVDANTGWIAMYSGTLYKTTNGGNNWTTNYTSSSFPFAKFRSLGFFNSQFGLLGTLNSFAPLLRTTNGGTNWSTVNTIPNPVPYGICGISVVDENIAYACGRYAAPANVIKTTNKGATWTSLIISTSLARSLVDCYFWSADSGIVVGGFNTSSYQNGNSVVLKTVDGGITWQRVYISSRSAEWGWKISFVSKTTGYVSLERHTGFSYILKTTNSGNNWTEIPFTTYDQEGIGFIDENTGWIGGWSGPTYATTNGGSSWSLANWGYFINRFRFLNDTLAYAVGDRVYKYERSTSIVPLTRFAVIGDFGLDGPNLLSVKNLVNGWNPNFILTLGNNNYELGEATTIDNNIGQYFQEYISPYSGSYGAGDTVNRFFPALGETDWLSAGAIPYLNYFNLPGNERYYDFIKGNVHFYCINSDVNEPDGIDSNSVQAQWLKTKLAESSETFNLVYFHQPPYSSGSTNGSETIMRWPFKNWGATAVLSGNENNYERLNVNGMTYFVNGLGGKSLYPFASPPVSGSQVRYNGNYGAMLIESYTDNITFRFKNITTTQFDYLKITTSPKTLTLGVIIEGLYTPAINKIIGDLVNVYLRSATFPFDVVDSAKGFIGQTGIAFMNFSNSRNATDYYMQVKQKNSIETWSSGYVRFIAGKMNYDFTTSQTKAYGNNLILKGTKYCFYSGDVNQDGIIDATDISSVDNAVEISLTGSSGEDLTGDFYVDAADLSIVENNASMNVIVIKP